MQKRSCLHSSFFISFFILLPESSAVHFNQLFNAFYRVQKILINA